jgi:predicted AlkP superfamily pyrophosphatase or phosphodiesterase
MWRRQVLAATLLAGLSLPSSLLSAQSPKLVVLLVVDQMRADYVERFQQDWSGGLKRLVTHGAWFRRAFYPYLETVTCPGHATISTGALPMVHGVFQNSWFDRSKNAIVTCTEDSAVGVITYGQDTGHGGDSPAALRMSTLSDEMRRQRDAHVVSVSLKARGAIMLAGHGGDAVVWLSDTFDRWKTSATYAGAQVPAVAAFIRANPLEADFGRVWEAIQRYSEPDRGLGEVPPAGWTATFPHALRGLPGATSADTAYYAQWAQSPFANAYLGRMAASLADSMQLGKHEGTDLLAISFSSPDLIGHAFGPRSQEIRDTYAHLDRTLEGLLEDLDRLVGEGQYVVALSSDHGVTEIPEQRRAEGADAGRIDRAGMVNALETAIGKLLGPGPAVARVVANNIYLQPGVFSRLSTTPGALPAVIKAVQSRPGVGRVFHADELATGRTATDELLRTASLSFVSGRSGDLVILPKEGWIFGASAATHGSASPGEQHVPVILYGAGIKAGRYDERVTPADIAPTLASLIGVTMPQARGRILSSALIDPSRVSSTEAQRP